MFRPTGLTSQVVGNRRRGRLPSEASRRKRAADPECAERATDRELCPGRQASGKRSAAVVRRDPRPQVLQALNGNLETAGSTPVDGRDRPHQQLEMPLVTPGPAQAHLLAERQRQGAGGQELVDPGPAPR